MRPAGLRALAADRRGATIIEFAIVAPVLVLLLVAAFDLGHSLYLRAVMQGIVQKAGRDSALENGTDQSRRAAIDEEVEQQIRLLVSNASITKSRRFHRSFDDAATARPETFTDTNNDGQCDSNEPFDDRNRNGRWDRDGADEGQGGAKDAVIYTVTVDYERLLPIQAFIGGSKQTRVVASSVLKNQPYGDQQIYGAAIVGNCP